MASSSSDKKQSSHLLFGAAYAGNISHIKALGRQVDDEGIGLRRTIAGIRDPMNQTLLHAAARGGKLAACDYLIDHVKLDVNAKDKKGETPLLNAIQGEHFVTAMHLLNKGARPNVTNSKSFSPLYYAAEKGHGLLVHLLLAKGACVDALSCTGTPLQKAASKGNEEAVKILLENHANANLFLQDTPTPLSAAVLANSLRCVELLIKAGANPNAITCGESPLALAASEGQTGIIKCLLGAGADPNVPNNVGMTPLEIAAFSGHTDDVDILFEVTSPINGYLDWSIDGVIRHIFSDEESEQLQLKVKKNYSETKKKGDKAFMYKDYESAIFWYTMYLNGEPWEAISNRGLCWAHKQDKDRAMTDASLCIKLRPTWSLAYINAALMSAQLGLQKQADNLYATALKIDPENEFLQQIVSKVTGEASPGSMEISEGS